MVQVKIKDFYKEYTAAMHEMYSLDEINNSSLMPKTQNSFQRGMSRKAGISLDKNQDYYTEEDLKKIIADTQEKINEYKSGQYSEALSQKGIMRYTMCYDILKKSLSKLGLSVLFEETEQPKEQEQQPVMTNDQVPFYLTEEEERRAFGDDTQETEEPIKQESNVTAMSNPNEEQIIAMIPSLLDAMPKFIEKSRDNAAKVKELSAEIEQLKQANEKLQKEVDTVKIPDTDQGKRTFIEEIAKQLEDPAIIRECSRDLAMLFVTKS